MKTYCTMSNRELVDEYTKILVRRGEIINTMVTEGQGLLRLSDMRSNKDLHPMASEFVNLTDEVRNIWAEAEVRYGPGLVTLEHLVIAMGPHYKRMREGT